MTTLLLDTDSLIKLTKAGAKELIVKHCEVIIPLRVKQESVDEAIGKPDAVIIERNINTKKIKVITTPERDTRVEREIQELGLKGGERELYRLSAQKKYDLLSSDDQKFLRLLQLLNKKAITPASLVVWLYQNLHISQKKAHSLLAHLQPMISDEESHLCLKEIGGKNGKHSKNHTTAT